MKENKVYDEIPVSREIIVPGELKQYFQTLQWKAYPATEKYPAKMLLIMNWKPMEEVEHPKEKPKYAKRSTYFMKPEHIERLIIESCWANLQMRERVYKPFIPLGEARLLWLGGLLKNIREEILRRWQMGQN